MKLITAALTTVSPQQLLRLVLPEHKHDYVLQYLDIVGNEVNLCLRGHHRGLYCIGLCNPLEPEDAHDTTESCTFQYQSGKYAILVYPSLFESSMAVPYVILSSTPAAVRARGRRETDLIKDLRITDTDTLLTEIEKLAV